MPPDLPPRPEPQRPAPLPPDGRSPGREPLPERESWPHERAPWPRLREHWLRLRERWLRRRDRWLSDPRFQRRAAASPLLRGVAARESRAVFDLCAGFVYSQVLLACVRLGVLDLLQDGPRPVAALADALGLTPERAARLLAAAASLGLVEGRGADRYGLGRRGAALLGNPGARAMIEHHDLLYADLADPVALLRAPAGSTRLAHFWGYAAGDGAALSPDRVADYTALMAASQQLVAADLLDCYRLDRHRRLMDVGGGDGSFVAAVAARAPALALALVDLPAVVGRARAALAERGLAGRVALHACDFRRDPLPAGHDLVTLVRVLHDHDDEPALDLLRAVHRCLAPGGTLLVAEPMAGARGAEPVGAAYFGMYLLAMGSGRARSPGEIAAMARAAGFRRCTLLPARRPLLVQAMACLRD